MCVFCHLKVVTGFVGGFSITRHSLLSCLLMSPMNNSFSLTGCLKCAVGKKKKKKKTFPSFIRLPSLTLLFLAGKGTETRNGFKGKDPLENWACF